MAYRSNSPPTLIWQAPAATVTGAISAGLRPGERYTACNARPSTRLAAKGPAMNSTWGSSACSRASCGGASRVSATMTWAPQRTHQRAMARPEAPRPSTSTRWSASGARPSPGRVVGAAAGSSAAAAGSVSATGAAASGSSAAPTSAKMRATNSRACSAAETGGACQSRAGAAAGAGAATGAAPGAASGMEASAGSRGSWCSGFIAVSAWTGPSGTAAW